MRLIHKISAISSSVLVVPGFLVAYSHQGINVLQTFISDINDGSFSPGRFDVCKRGVHGGGFEVRRAFISLYLHWLKC